jgi:hypothetical protein
MGYPESTHKMAGSSGPSSTDWTAEWFMVIVWHFILKGQKANTAEVNALEIAQPLVLRPYKNSLETRGDVQTKLFPGWLPYI